jgi:hypothetical protein
MATTNLPYGSPQAITLQSAGLFAANMQRNTTLNRLTGKFPQQADAESTIRKQSSNEMPIVRCMDLQKMAGDEITFDLINPMGGKPIMGSRNARVWVVRCRSARTACESTKRVTRSPLVTP